MKISSIGMIASIIWIVPGVFGILDSHFSKRCFYGNLHKNLVLILFSPRKCCPSKGGFHRNSYKPLQDPSLCHPLQTLPIRSHKDNTHQRSLGLQLRPLLTYSQFGTFPQTLAFRYHPRLSSP